ncbi:MAG: DsbC family protein [Pseudomonadota bacterium]
MALTACKAGQVASKDTVNSSQSAAQVSKTVATGADAIKRHLEAGGQIKVDRVEESPMNGVYAVILKTGDVLYSDSSGEFFVAGDLYQMASEQKEMINLTESYRGERRVALLSKIVSKDTITFKAKGKPKSHVYVFTDVDCYYCQKLHQEIGELNGGGLEVRYLAFPRAGINSASYKKVQSAWCSKTPQESLTKLKNRQSIPENLCSSKAVAEQYKIGQQLGVRGTPAIITASGEQIAGYMPAKALLTKLGVK